jgi:TolB-like protein
MSLLEELKRRNVFRVGIAYVVIGWLLAQVAEFSTENFGAPEWALKTFVVFLLLGFVLALFFAWAFELTPEGLKKEKNVDRSQSITSQTGRKLDFTIIGVLVMALGYFAWDKFAPQQTINPPTQVQTTTENTGAPETPAPPAEPVSAKSIAVLPFVNMSDDASNEYFSDGISEEILNSLAKIRELKVAGRTSSFSFKGKNQDLRQIGEALGVAHILEGSVRKSGDTVRITAQLIQVDDGFHLWSESYDRQLTDVFAIQDEISTAILVQLKTHLLDTDARPVESVRTNSQAYDLYLLARQRIYERARLSLESATELLDEAITLDANYAPAYAQRAIATLLLGDNNYGVIPKQQAESQAKLYLDKALQLDPELAEAWAGLGLYHNNRVGEFPESVVALEKALSINPNLINARNWLLGSHAFMGNADEALLIVDDMIALDPLYRPGIANAIMFYNQFGQQEKSLALLDRVEPFMPYDTNITKGRADVYFSKGEYAKGLPLAEASLTQLPDQSTAKDMLSRGLFATHQYERVVDIGVDYLTIASLLNLGRQEEALIRAFESVDSDGAGALFYALNVLDRSDEVVSYIDKRWKSLDELEEELPPFGGYGYGLMNDVALAYARAGDEKAFTNAMSRVRETHDRVIAQGARNQTLWVNEAVFYALSGDNATAMLNLSRAIDAGLITSTRISFDYPALEPLEGDPSFEALQTRMIEHLNRERQQLGLEPVST